MAFLWAPGWLLSLFLPFLFAFMNKSTNLNKQRCTIKTLPTIIQNF